ncbi:MAG: thioredoxin family protein [Acidobacteria bacterium]|nr:thioredoxin family protein [Acidobacteriota bacterium]MCB9377206.1 thioredoxin family protein [Holophagales bacterium]
MRYVTSALLLAALSGAPAVAEPPRWHDHADAAFAEAKESGKIVLVDLYADWCGWCKVMDAQVFTTPEFQQFAADFVLLRVDVEDGGDGTEIQRRFNAASLPTLLLLDGKQALVGQVPGFNPTAKLLARIRSEIGKHAFAVESYEKALASDDPVAWERKAIEWHQRGDGARSAALFEKLVARNEPDATKVAWRRYLLADAYRMDERFEPAREALEPARKAAVATGDPRLVEQVDWLGFAIARDAHDCTRAEGALGRLEKEHPKSSFASEARREWTSLKSSAQCS